MGGRQLLGEIHAGRRMGRMTGQTIGRGHLRRMGRMAGHAVFLIAMFDVTKAAIDFQMFARGRLHRLIDLGVTAQAGGPGLPGLTEIEFERGMGVVAGHAPAHLIMAVVGGIVTGGALGHHPFGLRGVRLVAGNTGDFGFMGQSLAFDLGRDLTMTRGAVRWIDLAGKGNIRRFMRRMTAQTIGVGHFLAVALVTNQAIFEFAMFIVAFPAIDRRVGGWVEFHEPPHFRVTGNTNRLDLLAAIQIQLQGLVGVMARGTGFTGVMELFQPGVTGPAAQNGFLAMGFVAGMARGAGGLLFMRRTLRFDLSGFVGMTGSAQLGRHVLGIFQGRRLMGRMTAQTSGIVHARRMGLMTTEAGDILAMGLMALLAVQVGVGAGHRQELLANLGMTGETGRLDRFQRLQIDLQRSVRRMALGAAAQLEVGTVRRHMAGGAGNAGGHSGLGMRGMTVGAADARMSAVTVGATDRGAVLAPLLIEIRNLRLMASRAQGGRRRAAEIGEGRFVRRMAAQTLLVGHGRRMRLMAVEAGKRLAMAGMALVAPHLRMDAGELGGLFARTFMTGDAGRPNVAQPREILCLGRMGIVTASAIFHGEVRLIGGRVTIGASGNRSMLPVAAATANFLVFPTVLGEQRSRTFMAGAAEIGANLRVEFKGRWRMGGMALLAILPGHRCGMGLMALPAVGEQPMLTMAVGACLLRVGIADLVHLGLRLGVAGNAGRADVFHVGHRLGQRRVRRMAGLAILQPEVGIFVRQMAADAGLRRAVRLGRMFGVTAETADLVEMRAPLGL